ncbi:MAG: hypothetical protein CM1200mP39_06750 [Dehalococcoidia bacterium]|nr:MAG: hypothetical protein CM1200mP39_06750 [Dehalococcoidia bacterium]
MPAATYAEQTSTVTNLERRVQLLRITAESREEVRTGWETICLMLRQWVGLDSITLLHLKYFPRFQVPSQITLIFAYSTQSGGIQWPTADGDNLGKPTLFASSDELITVIPLDYDEFANSVSDNQLIFAPGRVLNQPERDVKFASLRK